MLRRSELVTLQLEQLAVEADGGGCLLLAGGKTGIRKAKGPCCMCRGRRCSALARSPG
jgi:hypothetical protein